MKLAYLAQIAFVFFVYNLTLNAQQKSMVEHKIVLDNYINDFSSRPGFSDGQIPGGGLVIEAAKKSHGAWGQYFEGAGILHGLTRAWQASGDFNYLDKALDIIESDMDGAVYLDDFYNTKGVSGAPGEFPKIHYRGWVSLKNWFQESGSYPLVEIDRGNYLDYEDQGWNRYFPPIKEFVENAPDSYPNNIYDWHSESSSRPSQPLSNLSGTQVYAHYALQNNIYGRFVADVVRVMNKFPDIMSLTSSNGEVYSLRFDRIVKYIEKEIWEKWVEAKWYENQNAEHVYRVNTHMSSHLASVAVSLWSVTGNDKYMKFIEEFLYDFGSNPNAKRTDGSQSTVPGVGLMDLFYRDGSGNLVYHSQWNFTRLQDTSHSLAEYHFLYQCLDEGIGQNPPNGEQIIDKQLMYDLATSWRARAYDDWGGGGETESMYAEFNIETYSYFEPQVTSGVRINNQSAFSGNIMYAAAALGVNGSAPPVFPSLTDNINEISNFPPTIILNGDTTINLNLGENYEELGATWTDREDGSGDAEIEGSVDVDTAGTYIITYSYTDTGNRFRSVSRNVIVENPEEETPDEETPDEETPDNGNEVLIDSFSFNEETITVNVGDQFIPDFTISPSNPDLPYVWIKSGDESLAEVDGNGYVTALKEGTVTISGQTLDGTNLSDGITVLIVDNSIPITSFSWDNNTYTEEVGERFLPTFTIAPENATKKFIWVQSSNPSIASVDSNGFITGVSPGIVTISGTTLDGTNIVDTIELKITASQSPLPSLNVSEAKAIEGNPLNFNFQLSKTHYETIVIKIDYTNKTTNDDDYNTVENEITFQPGETEKTLSLQTNNDEYQEGDESLSLTLNAESQSGISGDTLEVIGTIEDDDIIKLVNATVYPNPVNSSGIIYIDGLGEGDFGIDIYSLGGQLVMSKLINSEGTTNEMSLPNLITGIYVLRITGFDFNQALKIIVN